MVQKKDSPVHEASANAEFQERVHSLTLLCKRLFPRFKPMISRLHDNNFTIASRLPFKSQLQSISLRMQTLKSTQSQALGEAMKGVTKAMGQMNLAALQRIMQEFEMPNEKMEMVSEVMGDAIDDALEGDEEETEELANQVLDEIGIDFNSEGRPNVSSTVFF